ncbi:MAG: lycopene cyclase family protein [Planctomycetota bacterium]
MTTPRIEPGARVAIAGAGCAGTSIAVELVRSAPGVDITLFDADDAPPIDRTWCSWSVREHAFTDAISERWPRVRVRGNGRDTTCDTGPHPYVCIRGTDFFRLADERLEGNATIHRSTRVLDANESADAITLRVRKGDAEREERFDLLLDARTDARPANDTPREPVLIQHFAGFEIDASGADLDTGVVTLMDFDVPQETGAHFMYVLPFSDGTALVESTFMTPPGYRTPDYESYAREYARRELGLDRFDVRYRESGALPMTLAPLGPPPTARTWPIGTRAGVGRASSGYAFDAIQLDTQRVVRALLDRKPRPRPPRSRLLSVLDRVLLSWLADDPSVAPEIFATLFARCPTPALIRFLADRPSAGDLLATMWAMPKRRTVRHALTHPSAWPRPTPTLQADTP